MEDNVALGIRISVTVVLVASLVAIVLTLMVIGQSILGSGQNKLQTGLTQVQQQDLMQYSNVVKKGSTIKSAINMYQGEPIAILVKTSALSTADAGFGDGNNASTQPTSGKGKYFNYGCLLVNAGTVQGTDGKSHVVLNSSSTQNGGGLKTLQGQAHLESTLYIQNGVKQTNYDTSGISSVGNAESILDNGLFYCQLIKDITGEIIGICFTQQAS